MRATQAIYFQLVDKPHWYIVIEYVYQHHHCAWMYSCRSCKKNETKKRPYADPNHTTAASQRHAPDTPTGHVHRPDGAPARQPTRSCSCISASWAVFPLQFICSHCHARDKSSLSETTCASTQLRKLAAAGEEWAKSAPSHAKHVFSTPGARCQRHR